MKRESLREGGIILILLPAVMFGGVSILTMLARDPDYMANPLRQDLWRAGHAHAGVMLILSLIALRYLDDTNLSPRARWFVSTSIPSAAIFLPVAFFLSVASPDTTEPNALINLAYLGAALLAAGVVTLGVGLIRRSH